MGRGTARVFELRAPSGTEGYEDLVRTALKVDIRGEQMPVASLEDIIRAKEAAGRPKDFTALPALQERLMAQQGTSSEEQAAAMALRAEERPTSDLASGPPGTPHREVTTVRGQTDRHIAEYRKLSPPGQSGPSLGR
jgi:hypothetical protein